MLMARAFVGFGNSCVIGRAIIHVPHPLGIITLGPDDLFSEICKRCEEFMPLADFPWKMVEMVRRLKFGSEDSELRKLVQGNLELAKICSEK